MRHHTDLAYGPVDPLTGERDFLPIPFRLKSDPDFDDPQAIPPSKPAGRRVVVGDDAEDSPPAAVGEKPANKPEKKHVTKKEPEPAPSAKKPATHKEPSKAPAVKKPKEPAAPAAKEPSKAPALKKPAKESDDESSGPSGASKTPVKVPVVDKPASQAPKTKDKPAGVETPAGEGSGGATGLPDTGAGGIVPKAAPDVKPDPVAAAPAADPPGPPPAADGIPVLPETDPSGTSAAPVSLIPDVEPTGPAVAPFLLPAESPPPAAVTLPAVPSDSAGGGSITGIPAVETPPPVPAGAEVSAVTPPVPFSVPEAGRTDLEPTTGSPSANTVPLAGYSLTTPPGDAVNGEQSISSGSGWFAQIGEFVRDLVGDLLGRNRTDTPYGAENVPAGLPSAAAPPAANPVESFTAGYIGQRDLEETLGREDWTMCCAATFIYALQCRYPELEREAIIEAAGKAAETPLADGSGPCVSGDGYVNSLWQYSQALSKNLELTEYVDTPGAYPTVEAAQAAGVEMMKVELSGTLRDIAQQHHVLQTGNYIIDPAGPDGIEDIWDKDSIKTENVMALEWYELPRQ